MRVVCKLERGARKPELAPHMQVVCRLELGVRKPERVARMQVACRPELHKLELAACKLELAVSKELGTEHRMQLLVDRNVALAFLYTWAHHTALLAVHTALLVVHTEVLEVRTGLLVFRTELLAVLHIGLLVVRIELLVAHIEVLEPRMLLALRTGLLVVLHIGLLVRHIVILVLCICLCGVYLLLVHYFACLLLAGQLWVHLPRFSLSPRWRSNREHHKPLAPVHSVPIRMIATILESAKASKILETNSKVSRIMISSH